MERAATTDWLFGYGSVIWRPSFPFEERRVAITRGRARRFWQASEDHRGVPGAPGRVVALVEVPGAIAVGVAYRLPERERDSILAAMDHREKGGYVRATVRTELDDRREVDALTYLADVTSPLHVGAATDEAIAACIASARGPSGDNREYLLRLADAIRELATQHPSLDAATVALHDAHLFAIETLLSRR